MKRLLITLIAFLVAYAGISSAHGPTRKKVVITRDIAAPPDKVWSVIGDFQNMSWHTAVTSTTGEGGNQPGATRTLTLGGGGQIFEVLEQYDGDKHALFYRIEQVDVKVLPVTNYSSWINVTPTDGGSRVTWKGAFYRGYPNNDPPADLSDQAAVDAVTGVYESGLDNAKKVIEGG